MAQSYDVKKIDALDLTRLTVEDVLSMRNVVMRRALLEVFIGIAKPPEHTSHATHSNHSKSIAIEPRFDNPIVESN